jgi:hypothetical protein
MLVGAHQAGKPMSSSSKGSEREHFIGSFLSEVFPPPFRFGQGDATDAKGRKSGQLDVVVELPFLPSVPIPGGASRLYLAEGVGAVIEVKSDLAGQWSEVQNTAAQLAPLRREFGTTMSMGAPPSERIPLYAVGYTGWKTLNTVQSHLSQDLDGILVIDAALFASSICSATGDLALWALVSCLHQDVSSLKATSAHPFNYIT